jgi:hypothetical protein
MVKKSRWMVALAAAVALACVPAATAHADTTDPGVPTDLAQQVTNAVLDLHPDVPSARTWCC